jgi:hypothetical protein
MAKKKHQEKQVQVTAMTTTWSNVVVYIGGKKIETKGVYISEKIELSKN